MANVKISEMVDVWSNGGTIFNGIKMDVTDTASSASSKLINMQVGSSDVFTVDKSGNIATTGSATVAGITSSGDVVPDADNAHDLGSDLKAWKDGHFKGSVGIGVAPTYKLDVSDAATVTASFTGTGTSSGIRFQNNTVAGGYILYDSSDAITMQTGSTERLRLNSTGLGIGGTPGYKLDVRANSDSDLALTHVYNASTGASAVVGEFLNCGGRYIKRAVNYTSQFYQENAVNVTTKYVDFDTHIWRNNAGTARITLNSSGSLRWHAYGAGTLTTDASGNITATSDERLKENIVAFDVGLNEIKQINPISYNWTRRSGMDRMNTYHGVSAQNVEAAIPEAIGVNVDGYKTVQDRPLIAALINAVKTLEARVAELEAA